MNIHRHAFQATKFNADYLGDQTPWFGPVLDSYRTVIHNELYFFPPGSFELTVWVWDTDGQMVGEKTLGEFTKADSVTVDVDEVFPDMAGRAGMIGTVFHSSTGRTPPLGLAFYSRFYKPDGSLAAIVNSANALNLNHRERAGRKHTYRMCSQQIYSDTDWRPLSWHGNVSSNPEYDDALEARVILTNDLGEKLVAEPARIAPFGSLLLDIEALFGGGLHRHLARSGGRGSLVVTSDDAGAIGYHFMQQRNSLELAGDHTRPVWKYLNMSYGASAATTDRSLVGFLKGVKNYMGYGLRAG